MERDLKREIKEGGQNPDELSCEIERREKEGSWIRELIDQLNVEEEKLKEKWLEPVCFFKEEPVVLED